jgi:tRNA-Thr(GGU) m(6)t(6)A37 methyltransferase TsaA
MVRENEVRPGELAVETPPLLDAALLFIGRIHTPWTDRLLCPRQGRLDGPICTLEIFDPWVPALKSVERHKELDVVYWLHLSRRDLAWQSPANDGNVYGTFSLRSPVRPNPIGLATVRLVDVVGRYVRVQGLDCLDGTPLLDLKPELRAFVPIAPAQSGDFDVDTSLSRST